MELTKKYFDQTLAEKLRGLATKEDLKEAFEGLARIAADGFAEAAKRGLNIQEVGL